MEDPKFKYEYGSSFMMAVCSFGLTELAGVFSVYLYITIGFCGPLFPTSSVILPIYRIIPTNVHNPEKHL
jgi:uncharacterized membrane protein